MNTEGDTDENRNYYCSLGCSCDCSEVLAGISQQKEMNAICLPNPT